MTTCRLTPLLTLALAACAGDATVPSSLDQPPEALGVSSAITPTVVLDRLDNPRGLAFGPDGALYVTEAGNTSINGACIVLPRGESCYSGTGAVTRLQHGVRQRIVSGLPSVTEPVAGGVAGPHDIGFVGRGNALVSIGFGADPAVRAGFGAAGSALGSLVRISASGEWRVIADISAVETALNPAGGPVDSNPYGLLVEPSGSFVTDAGGNSLVSVSANGSTGVVTAFAPTPAPPPFNQSEAVPTEVERGPDGALYVSTLTGAPFALGAAAIYRLDASGSTTVYAGGFKTIIDFAFYRRGALYVLEYDSAPLFFGGPGRLTLVRRDGSRVLLSSALSTPTGVTVAPDGAVYVSNRGNQAGVGEVLRFDP